MSDALLGAGIAFLIATVTTPVGISGAVFLVPVQVSLLHTPSPSVTPTNLLYNLIATPGALARYAARGIASAPLTSSLVMGTLPGVVIGAVIRVELLAGPDAFYLVIAAVLAPLGAWLALGRSPAERTPPKANDKRIIALALLVGTIGGIYGIGGGSLLAPILVGVGFSMFEVAPAALASTFLTSIVGVAAYAILSLRASGSIAPDWIVGVGIGVGGLLGGFLGASIQPRVPEELLRRGLGPVGACPRHPLRPPCGLAAAALTEPIPARGRARSMAGRHAQPQTSMTLGLTFPASTSSANCRRKSPSDIPSRSPHSLSER